MASVADYLNKRIAQVSNTVKSHMWQGHGHTNELTFSPTAGATSQSVPWEGACDSQAASMGALYQSQAALQNNTQIYQSGVGQWTTQHTGSGTPYIGVTGTILQDTRVDELQKTVGRLLKRIEWLESQPILKDNPPPIGLIEGED